MRVLLIATTLLLASLAFTPAASAAPEPVRCMPAFGGGSICWIQAAGCVVEVYVDGRGGVSAWPTCPLWP